ncbi:hypothetical protein SR1949_21180 [Sphaerospermopsis reniformis]|uniref:DUF3352 domain-containing protein n=1 Tax=Sphaerospermopsis reniformis TaxID=531300 RepID=A0A480A0V2_9CYAN|nr:DUF3352 domain-containing protein [Sphaerospermopsis reniformis]GCL37011.1 hypothetical protein SR1949_21180 [Sphaerospermopsis reniformis]
MALPIVSSVIKKKKKPSLIVTLSTAGLLIGAGSAAYWFFTQGQPLSRNLPVGANIIPQDALFAVSFTTDTQQWKKLREFGTPETQKALDKNLIKLQQRLLTNNGYNFEKDIQPWVGDEVTIAVLAPSLENKTSKQVATDAEIYEQSMVMILPIKNPETAKSILAQPKSLKQGKWIERTYQGITIKQTQEQAGQKLSAALIDQHFIVITDNAKTTERTIDAYKNQASLATLEGFATNFSKTSSYKPFAQFYINVPIAAKIAAAAPNRRLPAQVLTQLQNNQGVAGNITLEPQGIRLKGVSWLNPNSKRVLAVENKAGSMQNRLPSETLMMLSGSNLQRLWTDYVSTSKGNPLSPIKPEKLRQSVKSLTNLDLEKDLLSWMKGEFSVAVIPNTPKDAAPDSFRAGLVFMIKVSDAQGNLRQSAETALQNLDEVVKNQYQFKVEPGTVAGKPVVNWISPFGTLTATHGWLDEDVLFFVLGAPVSDTIVPKPNNTLASTRPFQQTVPSELNPPKGQFFLDMERAVKSFTFNTASPSQQALLAAIHTVGVTTAVKDNRSQQYDIFLELKKGDR